MLADMSELYYNREYFLATPPRSNVPKLFDERILSYIWEFLPKTVQIGASRSPLMWRTFWVCGRFRKENNLGKELCKLLFSSFVFPFARNCSVPEVLDERTLARVWDRLPKTVQIGTSSSPLMWRTCWACGRFRKKNKFLKGLCKFSFSLFCFPFAGNFFAPSILFQA